MTRDQLISVFEMIAAGVDKKEVREMMGLSNDSINNAIFRNTHRNMDVPIDLVIKARNKITMRSFEKRQEETRYDRLKRAFLFGQMGCWKE